MVKGLYTAYTGMLNQQHMLDTITNNLANSATTGYKKEGATARAFDDMFIIKVKDGSEDYIDKRIGKASLGVKIGENYTDYTQGNLKITDNPYDLAITGDGFFEISYVNKADEQSFKYTRDGSFTVTNEGYLVTKDGVFVQGRDVNIQMSTIVYTFVDELGNIYQDNKLVDTIKIVDFEDYNYLKKFGENLYDKVDGYTEKKGQFLIQQGYLEASNANVISEMVEMITITRAFETNQKFVQSIDETLQKDVNLASS